MGSGCFASLVLLLVNGATPDSALTLILRGINAAALEQALRQQAAQLTAPTQDEGLCAIALDGKPRPVGI